LSFGARQEHAPFSRWSAATKYVKRKTSLNSISGATAGKSGITQGAQHRAGELGEEAFDEIEPGAVLGREGELEAADRLIGEPSLGLL
jgi:hypothetical protein